MKSILCLLLASASLAFSQGPSAAPAIEKKEIDPLEGTVWKWQSGGELRLEKDGVATHTRWKGLPGKWRRSIKGLYLNGGHGIDFTIVFRADGVGEVRARGVDARKAPETLITQVQPVIPAPTPVPAPAVTTVE